MKTELKAKFLQHLNQKKQEEGFTLIELLVVIIIIGILAAIALPSFLNQANKAKQSESKSYVGSLNRGQQAYFLENSKFATDVPQVGVGIATRTANYDYGVKSAGSGTGVYVTSYSSLAPNVVAPLKLHAGKVFLSTVGTTGAAGSNEITSTAILCESLKAGTESGAFTQNLAGTVCPTATHKSLAN